MPIAQSFRFTQPQLARFAKLFRAARAKCGLSQLQVAERAFNYKRSHCKVSRVERCAMSNVDAYAIERIAHVLGVPTNDLVAIDPKFQARATVARVANDQGFWTHSPAAAAA